MCEVVKNWVGTFDNKFYYCREHKVECQETGCVVEASPAKYPIRNTSKFGLGDSLVCRVNSDPVFGPLPFTIGRIYIVDTAENSDALSVKGDSGQVFYLPGWDSLFDLSGSASLGVSGSSHLWTYNLSGIYNVKCTKCGLATNNVLSSTLPACNLP